MKENIRRLWHEAGLRWSGLTSNDVVLASYPKSGNTWVRFMLAYLMLELNGNRDQVVNAFNISRFSPEVPGVIGASPQVGHLPRVVKTHMHFNKAFTKVLFLVRRPEDVMRSYFVYARARGLVSTQMSPMDFLQHPRYGVAAWNEHTRSYLAAASSRFTVQTLKYEDIKREPGASLRHVSRLLGLVVSDEQVERIVAQTSLERLREEESVLAAGAAGAAAQKEFVFFGGTQSTEISFTRDELKFIEQNSKDVVEALGYSKR